MTHPRTLRRRAAATVATAGLLASGLVALAAPSHAVETDDAADGTFSFRLNEFLNAPNPGRPNPKPDLAEYTAAYDATSFLTTWDDATGTVDPDGSATVEFDGTSVNWATTGNAWLTITDPVVDIDEAGVGTVKADVAFGTTTGGDWATKATTASQQDVTIVDLSVDPSDLGGSTDANYPSSFLSASYDFEEDEDGYTWSNLKGRWSAGFITFVAPWAYASAIQNTVVTTPSTTIRYPGLMSISVDKATPELTYATTSANYGDGVKLKVDGDGFRGVTVAGPPADNGVYVGVAEGSTLPDVTTLAGQSAFVGSALVTAAQMPNGSFSTTVDIPTAKLDPAKTYSIFTWQAHRHSNETQDTVTPLTIDWNALKPVASTVTSGGAASTTYGKAAVVSATVPGKGKVTLTGVGAEQSQTLTAAGTATFTVPATLAAGTYTATFAYGGGGPYTGSQVTKTFTVEKAGSTTAVAVKPKPTAKKAGKATVTGTAGAKVAVVVKQGKKTVKKANVTLKANGKGVVTLPKAAKGGKFTVTATYAGDANTKGSKDSAKYTVAKPKKAKKKR